MKSRTLLVSILMSTLAVLVHADTVAIAVRERSDAEDAPAIAAMVEQAAMDRFFQSGHIVFDLELDPDDEIFFYRAIAQAEIGGASTVVLINLELDAARSDTAAPGTLTVDYLDATSEEALGSFVILAADIERYREMGVNALAERMGDEAARAVIERSGGGDGW